MRVCNTGSEVIHMPDKRAYRTSEICPDLNVRLSDLYIQTNQDLARHAKADYWW